MALSDKKSIIIEFCREYSIDQELSNVKEKILKSTSKERNIEENVEYE